MNRLFILDPASPRYPEVRQRFLQALGEELRQGARAVKVSEPKRTDEQNALLWALLADIAGQVLWPVNGARRLMTSREWKAVFTAGLRSEQMLAEGINGGLVLLGESTSEMSRRDMSSLIDLMQAFGAERGVEFSNPGDHSPN